MKYYIVIISLLISLLIYACASITSPGGGPRDLTPPKLIESNPEDQQLNFKERKIELLFDEFIQLNDVKKEIIITPKLSEEIDVEYNGKTVTIEINEQLKENTTYTINFREAIQDITERNPAKGLKLAFSTGPFIDTAYIKGNVKFIMQNKPASGTFIALYYADDTLSILNQPPVYLTYTDKEGNYQLDNLAKGNYRIYALNDVNNNMVLDFKNEPYGFLSTTLLLDTGLIETDISMVYNNRSELKLQSARPTGKYFLAKFNKYVTDYKINSDKTLYTTIEEKNTVIKFYNDFNDPIDSIQVSLDVQDSTGKTSTFPVMVKFIESSRGFDNYSYNINIDPVTDNNFKTEGTITFSKPTFLLNKDSIIFEIDSLQKIPFDSMSHSWDENQLNLSYSIDFSKYINDSTNLSLLNFKTNDQSFISIDQDTSKYKSVKPTFNTKESFGIIEVEVNTEKTNYIVQLVDSKNIVIDYSSSQTKFSFNDVFPGSYSIRIIIDENNNGEWDPGNIYENIEPEPVYYYTNDEGQTLQSLKANWILGPLTLEF